MARKLNGPALSVAQSLAKALEQDNGPLITLRFKKLRGMLGKNLDGHANELRELLDDNMAARLTRITSFEF